MTWNGEDKFNTNFGAVVTIFLFSILIGFSVFRAVDVFKKLNPMISRTSFLRFEDDEVSYNPKTQGFDFAFGLQGLEHPLDPALGFYTIQYVTRTFDDGKIVKSQVPLSFSACGENKFNYTDVQVQKVFGIDKMMCLEEDQSYELVG